MAKASKKKDEDDEAPAPVESEGGEALEGEGLDEEGGKKFSAKKILLFVVLPIFLLAGIGGGLYFSGMLNKILHKGDTAADGKDAGKDEKKEEKKVELGKDGKPLPVQGVAFLEMPPLLVNLSGGTDDQPRYLRLKVQLELANQADLAAVQAVMPRVVDQFQTYLRELRVRDLRGSAGIYRLQMELLSRVNAAAYPTEVKDVLFQDILIQ